MARSIICPTGAAHHINQVTQICYHGRYLDDRPHNDWPVKPDHSSKEQTVASLISGNNGQLVWKKPNLLHSQQKSVLILPVSRKPNLLSTQQKISHHLTIELNVKSFADSVKITLDLASDQKPNGVFFPHREQFQEKKLL